jgi:hypothetical protein
MAIMRVPEEELLRQAVTERFLVLKCLLLGACGRLWSCSVTPYIKWHRFSRNQLKWCLHCKASGATVGGSGTF